MSTLLLVDLSYQCYRATAAHRNLSHGPHFTGGLFGFLSTVSKIIREVDATRMVVCQDIKPYWRSAEYPEYKLLRKAAADPDLLEAHKESLPLITGLLEAVGQPVLGIKGGESDDLIGSLVSYNWQRWRSIYAASNDSDLYQLLEFDNFGIIKQSTLDSVIRRGDLAAGPMAMTPHEFMLAQALQGTHNDIEGIQNVGPVTAFKAIKDPVAMRKLRERHGALIDRNMRLQKLPHVNTPKLRVPAPTSFNPRHLYSYCGRYGIETTKSMVDAFEQISQ